MTSSVTFLLHVVCQACQLIEELPQSVSIWRRYRQQHTAIFFPCRGSADEK